MTTSSSSRNVGGMMNGNKMTKMNSRRSSSFVDVEKGGMTTERTTTSTTSNGDGVDQLQPTYNPDGNPYAIAFLMLLKYGMPIILFIVIWSRRVKRLRDEDEEDNYNNIYYGFGSN